MPLVNKLSNVANVVFNGSPVLSNSVDTLLSLSPLLLKTVDKATAFVGDTLTYDVTITNPSLVAMNNLPFSDTLPDGCSYVADSFKVNGSAVTPTINGSTLSYTIPSIDVLGNAQVQFQVSVTGSTP